MGRLKLELTSKRDLWTVDVLHGTEADENPKIKEIRKVVEEEYQKNYNDYFDKDGRVYPLKKLTDTHYVAMKGGEV